jgi:putative PIN family toxin of toxin-antitoxin system
VTTVSRARVVFDTNVILSALLFTNGRLSWLVNHWQAGQCVPLVSRSTAADLTRTLAYRKFQLTADEQFEALGGYIPYCDVVEIVKSCPVLCRDPKDQRFLDLAESGKADLLITGDSDLLMLTGQTEFVIQTPEACRRTG